MKKLVLIAFSVLNVLIAHAFTDHPIKLTSSEIKYDVKTKSLRVECKVFIDDFAPAISASLLTSLNQSKLTNDDKKRIESYFLEKYRIKINSKTLTWKIKTYSISDNILTLIFLTKDLTIKKGDHLKIENSLLFEAFGDLQSNWMTIRFPPYIKNYNFESKIDDSLYYRTF